MGAGAEDDVTPEKLLSNTDWIRRIGRRLVVDEGQLDDMVQQTLIAAQKTPPRQEGNLRSWIYSVMANFLRTRIRSDRRRKRHEKLAARKEGVPGNEHALLLDELKEAVTKAVLSLHEPYRSTVVRHFYQEKTTEEIAREDNVPANTVRVRLQRAMSLLKERLDDHHRDERAMWLIPLLLYAGAESPLPL